MGVDAIRTQFFRANVGIIVLNDAGQVLALEREDHADSWQLPQGGLDGGEEPRDAALRELREETGLTADDVEYVAEHPDWLAYELPPEKRRRGLGRGQVQRWFAFRLVGDERRIRPTSVENPEFRDWRWMDMDELARVVIPFRRSLYGRLVPFVERVGAGDGISR